MSKRRRHIGSLVACVVAFLGIAIVYFHQRPPLLYYIQSHRCHELPTRLIRPAFHHIVNRDLPLPPEADGLLALFRGGRVPTIYVRFETDPNAIAYIVDTLGISGADWETYDTDKLRSGVKVFPILSIVQKRVRVCLFDQDSIESGRLLQGLRGDRKGSTYTVFIDDQDATVYIRATMD